MLEIFPSYYKFHGCDMNSMIAKAKIILEIPNSVTQLWLLSKYLVTECM